MILSLIAAVSLVVSGLGIMTVMMVSVNERTREIGIKKSIGATKGMILVEFLAEAFTLSLIGSMAGVGLGVLFAWIGCKTFSITFHVAPGSIISSIVVAVIVGVLFGVYPATTAAKLRPVDALRTE